MKNTFELDHFLFHNYSLTSRLQCILYTDLFMFKQNEFITMYIVD